ncbi:MAG: thymidylate kinase [Chloroflexi bacterium]|nr:MAG: thymidylate kinase [Chloroflexota bacterium]
MVVASWPLHHLRPNEPAAWQPHPWPGTLICVDGVDGSGRATQLDLLHVWLQVEGYGVIRSQWNSSKLVSKTIADARRQNTLTPLTYSILHATDLAERIESEIVPGLKSGYVVLADRYIFTALARDIARGVERAWIHNLYDFAVRPDLAVYLRIDPEVSMGRIMGIGGEASVEEANESAAVRGALESFRQFQERVVGEYERLVEPFDLMPLDAQLPIRVQQRRLREAVGGALLARERGICGG